MAGAVLDMEAGGHLQGVPTGARAVLAVLDWSACEGSRSRGHRMFWCEVVCGRSVREGVMCGAGL